MDALSVMPGKLDKLGQGVDQLGAIRKAALLVELVAILHTPVAIGVRDVILTAVGIHKDARLRPQVAQEILEFQGYRLVCLQSHDDLPNGRGRM